MTPYPTDLPIDDVKLIINAIRSGDLEGNVAGLAKAVYELVGYGLGQTIGEPGVKGTFECGPCPCPSNEQVADILQSYVDAPGVASATPIPWAQIIQWGLQLLLTFIK